MVDETSRTHHDEHRDNEAFLTKIHGGPLRDMAAGTSDQVVTVLIEPALPPPRVVVRHVVKQGIPVAVPQAVEPASAEEQSLIARRVAETGAFLEELLGTSPRWLKAPRTFIARVTPQQLRQLAHSPMIESIWPNSTLRRDHLGRLYDESGEQP